MSNYRWIPVLSIFIALSACDAPPKSEVILVKPTTGFFIETLNEMNFHTPEQLQNVVYSEVGSPPNQFTLGMQYFEDKKIVYLSINKYLSIDMSKNVAATAFTLTQLATLNHRVVGGKFQLNPKNGEITVCHEIYTVNGIDPENLKVAIGKLISIAQVNHLPLKNALGMAK